MEQRTTIRFAEKKPFSPKLKISLHARPSWFCFTMLKKSEQLRSQVVLRTQNLHWEQIEKVAHVRAPRHAPPPPHW